MLALVLVSQAIEAFCRSVGAARGLPEALPTRIGAFKNSRRKEENMKKRFALGSF